MSNRNKKYLTWRLYQGGVDSVLELGNFYTDGFHNYIIVIYKQEIVKIHKKYNRASRFVAVLTARSTFNYYDIYIHNIYFTLN